MCGIIGIASNKPVSINIINSLKKLEYRGYDSAGIATLTKNNINEKKCIEDNIPIKVVKLDYSCIARAIAMRKTQGFFKIIVTDDKDMKILGMRAVGEHASSAVSYTHLTLPTTRLV